MDLNLNLDPGQPVRRTAISLEPSHQWVLGLTVDDDGSLVGPDWPQSSYRAECECPDDCLRDHGNE
jgi:hypothetical protein